MWGLNDYAILQSKEHIFDLKSSGLANDFKDSIIPAIKEYCLREFQVKVDRVIILSCLDIENLEQNSRHLSTSDDKIYIVEEENKIIAVVFFATKTENKGEKDESIIKVI